MKKLFEKVITKYKERNQAEKDISINHSIFRDIKISLKDIIVFAITTKLKKWPELEGVDCETIFEDTSLEYYTY